MTRTILTAALVLAPVVGWGQDAARVQKLFEAGQYEETIASAALRDVEPTVLYLAAQSAQRLGTNERALEFYRRLASRPGDEAWRLIGLSGEHLVRGQTRTALESAQQAVATAHTLPEAQYQLGLVLARQRAWIDAAQAFARAAELQPRLAYAHYYAGLMYYRANRPDRMAIDFEQFLKLAPEAPERPEVLQIMRTVRGR